MKEFYFYSEIRLSDDSVIKKVSKLKQVYKLIPETIGCLENINKENGCGGWCCACQSPQLLYSEFLLIWDFVSHRWSDTDILDLFSKSMKNAVDDIPSKGCIFFDEKMKTCKIHDVRPYNCRVYGITPSEEFEARYNKFKERYKDVLGAVIKPQCNLISTVDGEKITSFEMNAWWEKLVDIEVQIGVDGQDVNDLQGGSYRSPHDHVLLYNMPANVISAVAGIRLYDSWYDKIAMISELMSVIKQHFRISE